MRWTGLGGGSPSASSMSVAAHRAAADVVIDIGGRITPRSGGPV